MSKRLVKSLSGAICLLANRKLFIDRAEKRKLSKSPPVATPTSIKKSEG